MADIRPSPIAGTWYPGNPKVLALSIDHYLQTVERERIEGEIYGIITPHAGHRYSGAVAAYAFRHLQDLEPQTVAVLSPLHSPHNAKLLTTAHTAYETPLGSIDIDVELLNQFEETLRDDWGLEVERVRADNEHALEIELPFIQRCFTHSYKLLPLMLRDQSESTAKAVGFSLANTLKGSKAIIIGSTDLSHFYSQETAERLDGEMLSRLEAFDPSAIIAAEDEGVGFACGRGAMAASLWAAQELGADSVNVVKYATSGAVTGDFRSVVGYGAAVIYRKAKH